MTAGRKGGRRRGIPEFQTRQSDCAVQQHKDRRYTGRRCGSRAAQIKSPQRIYSASEAPTNKCKRAAADWDCWPAANVVPADCSNSCNARQGGAWVRMSGQAFGGCLRGGGRPRFAMIFRGTPVPASASRPRLPQPRPQHSKSKHLSVSSHIALFLAPPLRAHSRCWLACCSGMRCPEIPGHGPTARRSPSLFPVLCRLPTPLPKHRPAAQQ